MSSQTETPFEAPMYMPRFTDFTLLIGPEEIKFEANRNVLASQSKFFEKMCMGGFKEAKESVGRLPEIKYETMLQVLRWCYRVPPEVPENFLDDEPAQIILAILAAARFLQMGNLAKDYSLVIGERLKRDGGSMYSTEEIQVKNCVNILNAIYHAGGSVDSTVLMAFLQRMRKESGFGTDSYPRPSSGFRALPEFGKFLQEVEEPNATFFVDLSAAMLDFAIICISLQPRRM